jgi:hypothetical protein
LSYGTAGLEPYYIRIKKPTDYGLHEERVGVRVPKWEDFSSFHVFQIGCGAYPASYLKDTGGFSPGSKEAGT